MHCAASASALASDSALVASVQRQCKWRAFLSYDPGLRCVNSTAAAAIAALLANTRDDRRRK